MSIAKAPLIDSALVEFRRRGFRLHVDDVHAPQDMELDRELERPKHHYLLTVMSILRRSCQARVCP